MYVYCIPHARRLEISTSQEAVIEKKETESEGSYEEGNTVKKHRFRDKPWHGRKHADQLRRYSDKRGRNPEQQKKRKECFRCGNEGHVVKDVSCPPRKATCCKCKKVGHFEKVCKSRSFSQRTGLNNVINRTDSYSDSAQKEFSWC